MADVATVTDLVVIVKVAVVLPAATVIEAGTVAEVLLLVRLTCTPPVGAALVNVTVPFAELPPVTLAGFSAIEESAAVLTGVIVRAAALLTP